MAGAPGSKNRLISYVGGKSYSLFVIELFVPELRFESRILESEDSEHARASLGIIRQIQNQINFIY